MNIINCESVTTILFFFFFKFEFHTTYILRQQPLYSMIFVFSNSGRCFALVTSFIHFPQNSTKLQTAFFKSSEQNGQELMLNCPCRGGMASGASNWWVHITWYEIHSEQKAPDPREVPRHEHRSRKGSLAFRYQNIIICLFF